MNHFNLKARKEEYVYVFSNKELINKLGLAGEVIISATSEPNSYRVGTETFSISKDNIMIITGMAKLEMEDVITEQNTKQDS